MTASDPKCRWFHLTPGHLLVVLLIVEAILLMSEWQGWFPFNQHKGWTVLISIAAVGVFLILMGLWFITALIFRKRFQFSIRSILMLTVAVAVPSSWRAVEIQQAKRQEKAVEAFKKLGASVSYDYDYEILRYSILNKLSVTLGEGYPITGTSVWFQSPATNDMLIHLKDLPPVTDLYIGKSPITDEGMVHIQHLTELAKLNLEETHISDAGLPYIKNLPKLGMLLINDTQITDEGLHELASCTNLTYLSLKRTRVSEEGAKKLQKSLPKCLISWEKH